MMSKLDRRDARSGAPRAVFSLAVAAAMMMAFASSAGAAQEVAGRLVLELTEAGARALRAGMLQLPIPPGGEAMHPRIEPLFMSRTGPLARFALVTFEPPDDADASPLNREWLQAMGASDHVTRGGADWVMEAASLPTDPYFVGTLTPRQFHLHNAGGLSERFARAWPFIPADREVIVAVIDSGVHWRHPDLGGALPPDARVFWRNAGEAAGTAGVDDDGNGKMDDFIGWDFVDVGVISGLPTSLQPVGGEDGTVPDNDPSDVAGHGTEAAGFINALTDNGVGIAGAAPAARIMPVRAGWLSNSGQAVVYMSFCAQAIEYAALNGARVINCSWDSDDVLGLGAALDLAIQQYGIVVVGSAGNNSTSNPPLSNPQYIAKDRDDCLGVGGVVESGLKAGGSNYGTWVDLVGFYGGLPTTTYLHGTSQPGYAAPSGTSFAAPQVAAAVALVRAAAPGASAATVRGWLMSTAQSVDALNPSYTNLLGAGIVDVEAAVVVAGGGWDAPERPVRALTPYSAGEPVNAPSFVGLGATAMVALSTASGGAAAGFLDSIEVAAPLDDELPVAGLWPGASSPLLVWREGSLLKGMSLAGETPAGWPVPIDADAGPPALSPLAATPEVFVPSMNGLIALRHDATADTASVRFPFACVIVAAGQLDDGPVDLAGVDAYDVLHIFMRNADGDTVRYDGALGPNALPPVIGEFAAGSARVVQGFSDPSAPGATQRIRSYRYIGPQFDIDSVSLAAPPLTALSLAGFAGDAHLAVVAADEAGGIHVIRWDGAPEVETVSAGGPIAGEVLCADLDGDGESDLLALRRDGFLFAWRSDLTPLAGFPRRFPHGAVETPLVADAGGTRYAVVADTTGGLWSLPVGPSGRPAPWPTARGNAGRSGYLSYARATPVEPGMRYLTWEWEAVGGRICWGGVNLDRYARLRVRDAAKDDPEWQGSPLDEACVPCERIEAACTLRLEALDRFAGWSTLGWLDLPAPGLRVMAPEPNPTTGSSRIAWRGARGPVTVAILDVRGRLVREERFEATEGDFTWDGLDARGAVAPAGLYFARVADGIGTVSRRLVRLR